jgi:excisionase family DNA binding protein
MDDKGKKRLIDIEVAELREIISEEVALQLQKLEVERSQVKVTQSLGSRYLTVEELMVKTRYRKNTIYNLVHRRKIPFFKKGGKLLFDEQAIDLWIKEGRVRTDDEVRKGAEQYLGK